MGMGIGMAGEAPLPERCELHHYLLKMESEVLLCAVADVLTTALKRVACGWDCGWGTAQYVTWPWYSE